MSENARIQVTGRISNVVGWAFTFLFAIIGILNLILVHPVPGLFYLVLATVYPPLTDQLIRSKFGFAIPLVVKIVIGLVVLWGTLAVTDLADIAGL